MRLFKIMLMVISLSPLATNAQSDPSLIIKTEHGMIEGIKAPSSIRSFKGIPFAKPPVGNLRWKEPQPMENWAGLRKADKFGNNAMQKQPFGDMGFRSAGMSEDCLYLNVWAPANAAKVKLPVLVYFFGGGFIAGDGSERRYDGEKMALQGIVTLTVNYRLGAFGFMAHPELTKESPNHASGNYGLMDQHAALLWVQKNIAAFGGDPKRVTIAGESAGSISVFAQMASPLSKNLIAGAIGESGAMIHPTLAAIPLEKAEQNGVELSKKMNAATLADLRALPAAQVLEEATKPGAFNTAATIDGYFLPKLPAVIFEAGEQAHVPLLAGWNSAEVTLVKLSSWWSDARFSRKRN
jgi:para-nitrobenzyl esterase